MSRPRLFTYPISHYCVSAERMLAFKGIAFDRVRVPYDNRQELIGSTGQDYVPALVWEDQVIPWDGIADFVEEKVPTPTLYPDGQRALARALEHWGHQVVEERVWQAVVTKVPPVLADANERWVFEEMQTRARGPWKVLEARRPEFEKEMVRTLRMVEEMLAQRAWILGEPSLADFGIYGSISPLITVGDPIPPDLPRLASWAEAIARIPG
ncbi:MAG: glutathione S-transferase family protein [Thermoplasmata archaeon]|nr:glutathione S-transferase family protein [Thermoplasmata archaeon]